jgi:3-carboxy-cis,cis-muconate cycloisomerase
VAAELSDRAWLQAMLDFEAALARAVAPAEAADAIAAACVADDGFDVDEIGRSTADKGTPVPGMLKQLRAKLPEEAAAHVHRGATSQDVVDSAAMLVARRALSPLLEDLGAAADACATLAERYREAPMAGRTLLQQALPVTFGLKAAGWLAGLDEAWANLSDVRAHGLAVQLGGAVGTLASLGDDGVDAMAAVAKSLELAKPDLPWHTVRTRPARLACALGEAAGAMAKVALDVELMTQTEVGELAEGGGPGRGGSSTLPHKRNPVGAVAVSACATRVPGLVATMLSAMAQEHERAAGAWQAESETLSDLLRLTGSAAATLRELLENVEPDPDRMRANLDLTGGLLMTESVVTALTPSLGRAKAQELVEDAAQKAMGEGRPVRDVLAENQEVTGAIGDDGLDAALSPESYLGAAGELIDRALAVHRA